MKRITILLAVILAAMQANAQFDTVRVSNNINTTLDSMTAAFKTNNWRQFAQYTNENMIKFMGGEDKFTELLDTSMAQLLSIGSMDEYYPGRTLQLVITPAGYQCITESFMQMTVSGITVSGCSYNIGTSPDGETWRFLRVGDGPRLTVNDFIPDVSSKLRIPEEQMEAGKTLEEFKKTYKIRYKKTTAAAKKPKPKTTGKTVKPKKAQ
jgi:hypothetical protein